MLKGRKRSWAGDLPVSMLLGDLQVEEGSLARDNPVLLHRQRKVDMYVGVIRMAIGTRGGTSEIRAKS